VGRILAGSWRVNYEILDVAKLTPLVARDLVGCKVRHIYGRERSGENCNDNWSAYEPRNLRVRIDYPIERPLVYKIPSSAIALEVYGVKEWHPGPSVHGASLGLFLLAVAHKYIEIYDNAEEYGVYAHSLDQLGFEGVIISPSGNAELYIGS
jgi:hypothetical protein